MSHGNAGHATASKWSLRGHLRIARIDHWVKNVFIVPGIVVALSLDHPALQRLEWPRLLMGLIAVCLITSSNYVLNELLDAEYDRGHPAKWNRPVPAGEVHIPLAYVEWIALMAAGLALGSGVSTAFAVVLVSLWIQGCIYNVPPLRTKELPYIDVLSEAVNNPLRMLAGWYLTGTAVVPPASLLMGYWMAGAYFMAVKRYAEYREFGNAARAAAYRKSFAYYTEPRLLIAIVFFAAHAMLFFGAFIARYRLELILAFPLVALVMAIYLGLAFKNHSAAQHPERLYREPRIVWSVAACSALMTLLLFVDVPALHRIFRASEIVR